MNLFFRLLRILLASYFSKERTHFMDVHTIRSKVWIGDHDMLGHMTNSRYASFTDLGIMNFMGRSGTMRVFRKHGWVPVIQHESLTYFRSISFPQAFEVQTQMVGWDGTYMCFRHAFVSGGRTIATSRMIARLVGRKKQRVTADMALEALGQPMESPPLEQPFLEAIAELRAARS
ncbi:MAG: thioesterase family protein [Hyphomonas sp.]|uniref:thioesterase family protein n=1 Tax=Hyphomonas sp. TaxID=87 RepID=UPI0035296929